MTRWRLVREFWRMMTLIAVTMAVAPFMNAEKPTNWAMRRMIRLMRSNRLHMRRTQRRMRRNGEYSEAVQEVHERLDVLPHPDFREIRRHEKALRKGFQ